MKPKLIEADVVKAVVSFLELDGWRAIKMEPISRREWGKGTGEIGQPDYLFLRYRVYNHDAPICEAAWVEFKAPAKKPTQFQLEWHLRERAWGALVLVVDDFDEFHKWYGESGLARKVRE